MQAFIDKWFSKVKPYLFKYKNGFFILPYINNSPQLMWQSLQKMPFIKFSKQLNLSETNTPFLNAKMFYEEIENDLVVFYNEIGYKLNVTYNHFLKENIPVEYYCLTVLLSDASDKHHKTIVNEFHFHGFLWILHKPKVIVKDYHFKHSQTKTIIIYFTEKWLHTYLEQFVDDENKFKLFMQSKDPSVGQIFTTCETGMATINKVSTLMREVISGERTQQLEQVVHQIMDYFKNNVLQNFAANEEHGIGNSSYLKMREAEKILLEHLHDEFPGITAIAEKLGISETKLKADFKSLFGTTAFQYYRKKQMESAIEKLEQEPSSVKDIALQFGYENASKFSIAFKKQHGISPSDQQQSTTKNKQ